ncbi:hypothetical protein FDK21_19400 [Cohaesibacter sp. CAU 1516]|uniref:hypothetical protein n=1 Tax=Cohaesibacter sp. CAU 1516 TaxID=2576038 RepID=UPI0010FE234F|nr:hypothetical protein [Cohaesibacter sp. CAU 1516]TLP42681.1 hypothetical protein FDK21_19400 [Cohaesibacter sp. CAU 1516]
MKNLGDFTRYEKPDNPLNILYFKNASGVDWYSLKEEQGSAFALVSEGLVTSVAVDITALVPDGQSVIVIEDGETIPLTGWAFDGEIFTSPAVEPETPPPLKDITRAQLIDVLLDLDVYEDQVTALLEAEDYSGEPDPAKAKARALNAWNNASYYRPDHPLIDQMRAVLNLTDQTQFEALWREAESRLV